MKKLLIIFVLLVFPFQMSWGVVDAYCQPGQKTGTEYCVDGGRESHVATSDDSDAPTAKKLDLDCSQCGVSSAAIIASPINIPSFSPGTAVHDIGPAIHVSAASGRPDRPQWPFILA